MKQWHHPKCLFEVFEKARATTKIIDTPDEIEGFSDLLTEDKEMLKALITDVAEKRANKGSKPAAKKATAKTTAKATPAKVIQKEASKIKTEPTTSTDTKTSSPFKLAKVKVEDDVTEDNCFRNFRKLCSKIADHPGYNDKSNIVAQWLTKGSRNTEFNGDTFLTVKLLLPGFVKRVYNINSKQLVKIFSQIFGTSLSEMSDHLDNGDVAETVKVFFEKSRKLSPQKHSILSLQEVDEYLEQMSKVTKEDDQEAVLTAIAARSSSNDLKMVVRLIKHDLRINAGAKHILEGLDSNAYEAFQASRNLRDVVDRVLAHKSGDAGKLQVRAQLMTPVLPMLAEACKSVAMAMRKCPQGMYAEIKYDGERVQLHKNGSEFQYFSRSLKPVIPHKVCSLSSHCRLSQHYMSMYLQVSHFKDYIPLAFPGGDSLILDSEVLLVDTKTSKPLPFGTLGVHKKAAFTDAQVCLYIFDCLYYNDRNLMNEPIKERRRFLRKVMTEIPNRVMFSEQHDIKSPKDLNDLLEKVFREGLEGLVLKGVTTIYEPGKRHWLKVKKDYLADGAMADTADLVVLGAYYGTGTKGGMMSVFLMGCYNPSTKRWCTVTKVSGGHDDETLKRLQSELKMTKISKDSSKIPGWLNINKGGNITPDFIITDPKDSQVWEITGAEFSKSDIHTADGISIRFPRVTKIRDDKDWKTATDIPRLKLLFEKSKETATFSLPGGSSSSPSSASPVKDSPTKNVKAEVKAGMKRAHEKSNSTSPLKAKKEKTETNGVSSVASEVTSSNKLSDVFLGQKFFISSDHSEFAKLKRYSIAFGAELVIDEDEADFIVQTDVNSDNRKHVSADWVFECIKMKKIVARG
ncbi:DNA ligase 3-like [Watersipora subatra]|uniref:DNA ligase 3-like n=1 Tax=Watersipora subatra TaxID=2589382 RepID=UPI00355BB5D9